MKTIAPDIQKQWEAIAPLLTIQNEQDYDSAVIRLNALLDEVGTDESHPLYTLLDTLSIIIQSYEDKHYAIPNSNGSEVLSYLIEEHSLSASELSEIGSQETVLAILKGEKELTVQQIKALSSRFQVSPSTFI